LTRFPKFIKFGQHCSHLVDLEWVHFMYNNVTEQTYVYATAIYFKL